MGLMRRRGLLKESGDTRVLLAKYDFTKSSNDEISGTAVRLGVSESTTFYRDSEGFHFNSNSSSMEFSAVVGILGKEIEVDIASMSMTSPGSNHRAVVGNMVSGGSFNSGYMFQYRYNNSVGWTFYLNGNTWGSNLIPSTVPNALTYFSGKTMRVKVALDGSVYLFLNGEWVIAHPTKKWDFSDANSRSFCIARTGSSTTRAYNPMVISGVRIYTAL